MIFKKKYHFIVYCTILVIIIIVAKDIIPFPYIIEVNAITLVELYIDRSSSRVINTTTLNSNYHSCGQPDLDLSCIQLCSNLPTQFGCTSQQNASEYKRAIEVKHNSTL